MIGVMVEQLRYHHDNIWRQARQLLRNAAEQQTGKTAVATSPDDEVVGLFTLNSIDDGFRRMPPSAFEFNCGNTHPECALSCPLANLIRCRFQYRADVSLDARNSS